MLKNATMDVAVVRRQFDSLLQLGIPRIPLENALEISRDQLAGENFRIPVTNNVRMIQEAVQLGGPEMAIKLGALATPDIVGILGKIMESCSNLGEATAQFIRFQNLYFGVSKYEIRTEGNYGVFTHTVTLPISDSEYRLITEVNLSVSAAAIRKLVGDNFAFHEVRLSYGEPGHSDAYREHFRCTCKFNQKEDAIVMHRKLGGTTIPGSYPRLKEILSAYAENLIENLENGNTFKDKVRRIISDLLPNGIVDIDGVSSQLGMSRWTLNRRLRAEGTRFRHIMAELRKEFATAYLDNQNLTITEIAFLLGYSEQSAFFRAFKKWTGLTPNQYRAQRGYK